MSSGLAIRARTSSYTPRRARRSPGTRPRGQEKTCIPESERGPNVGGETRSRPVVLTVFALAALLAIGAGKPDAAGKETGREDPQLSYNVRAIRAYLYYQDKRSFGERDIASGTVDLWNTVIGTSDEMGPSSSVLVVVELEGPNFTRPPDSLVLAVEIREDTRSVSQHRVPLKNFFSKKHNISVPIIVYPSMCKRLTIAARVDGAPQSRRFSANVPFACGE